ncbi:transposase InsO family protein [Mesorhizobium sp. USDA 4775]
MLIATSNFRVLRRPFESAQYAALLYRNLLAEHDLIGSMGRRGNPYDNAKAESFMKTMKVEAIYPIADSDVKPAAIPIKHRPPFRYEAGHHSNQRPAGFRH